MRTGADGIALAADRATLYWCPLSSRHLYSIQTELLWDFDTPHQLIEEAIVDHGDKGTNSDGLGADNRGRIYYTMLEEQGIGRYDPGLDQFEPLVSDKRLVWVDGMTFDNNGGLIFNTNRLHEFRSDELDWNRPDNQVIWRLELEPDVKSYMYPAS